MKVFVPIYYDGQEIRLARPTSGRAICFGYIRNVVVSRDFTLYFTNNACHRTLGIIVDVEGTVSGVEEVYPDVVTPSYDCDDLDGPLYMPRIPIRIPPSTLRISSVYITDVDKLVEELEDYEIEFDEVMLDSIRNSLHHVKVAVALE